MSRNHVWPALSGMEFWKMFSSPTFVARFADGTVTRMTTHYSAEKLDLGRGVRLSLAAYELRRKKAPPPMTAGRFEMPPSDGADAVIFQVYSADDLARATETTATSSPNMSAA